MSELIELNVVRASNSSPCPIPVVPHSPVTNAPMTLRTELCHVDAWWLVDRQAVCDVHFREMCELVELSYDEIVADIKSRHPKDEIPNMIEDRPWAEMHRYPQPGNAVLVDRYVDGED